MKNKVKYSIAPLLVLVFCTINCHILIGQNSSSISAKNLDSTHYKVIKSKQTFTFPIGEKIEDFGFKHFEDVGDISSVTSIRLIGHSIYLADQYHLNVKKIDLNTGELSVSKSLNRKSTYLTTIGYLNNQLYILTNFNTIYVLDLDLNYLRTIFLKDYLGPVFVGSETPDTLTILNMVNSYNNKAGDYCPIKMKIDKYDHCTLDSTEFNDEDFNSITEKSSGIIAPEITINKKMYLQINKFLYEIPESVSDVNDYNCSNVDYSNNQIVFFTINKSKIVINVLNY